MWIPVNIRILCFFLSDNYPPQITNNDTVLNIKAGATMTPITIAATDQNSGDNITFSLATANLPTGTVHLLYPIHD